MIKHFIEEQLNIMKKNAPNARVNNLVVQELPNEILICDLENNHFYCLNQTASEVWKLCDGKNDFSEIASKLNQKTNQKVSEELIWLTIDQFSSKNLLEEKIETETFFSKTTRREVIKKIGLTSMLALPLISQIIMPTPALAQSGGCPVGGLQPAGCPCSNGGDCISNCCLENFPGSPICGDTFGQQGCICATNADCDPSFECCAPANPVCNPGC